MIKKVNIQKIKPNDENPRFITDAKFKKLIKSIKEFPEMLETRPLVVDEDFVVLGGNMRLKALKSAGVFEVPIHQVKGWTDDQKKEFIIKDNLGYGEWDWDIVANEWDTQKLKDWGMDFPFSDDEIEEINNPNNIETEKIFANELDAESNYIVLKFDKDIDWIQAKTIFGLKTETARRANGKEWSSGIGRVLNGTEAIKKIKNEN